VSEIVLPGWIVYITTIIPYNYKDPSTAKHFAFRIKLNTLHLS